MLPVLDFFVGDTWPFKLTVTKDHNGDPIESENYDLWSTIIDESGADDANALVRMSTVTADARDGSISRTYDAETKILTFTWAVRPAITRGIGAGKYFFDIQIQAPLTRVSTLRKGYINAESHPTKRYNP